MSHMHAIIDAIHTHELCVHVAVRVLHSSAFIIDFHAVQYNIVFFVVVQVI